MYRKNLHTFGFGFVNLNDTLALSLLLNPFLLLLLFRFIQRLLHWLQPRSERCRDFFAHCCPFARLYPHVHAYIHRDTQLDVWRCQWIAQSLLVNKRPRTYHSLLPSLPLFADMHIWKQRWPVCIVKSQMLSSSCPGSIPTSQQMYEYFPSPLLQIRTCLMPDRANKYQTQVPETAEWETQGIK